MQFKVVNINRCLSLGDKNFSDHQYNIDYLAQKLYDNINLEEKLPIANRCISLCEKFHSYFHFEESYFNLLLAKSVDNLELRIQALEAAIFQDPLNYEAKKLLIGILPLGDDRLYDHRYIGDIKDEEYVRDLKDYSGFLHFAIGDSFVFSQPPVESYWHNFELYEHDKRIELLQSVVELVSHNHKLYHTEAAKVYFNRHAIFNQLGNDVLAKNDLIKAMNLDKNIASDIRF